MYVYVSLLSVSLRWRACKPGYSFEVSLVDKKHHVSDSPWTNCIDMNNMWVSEGCFDIDILCYIQFLITVVYVLMVYMIMLYMYTYIDHRPPDRIWIINYPTVTLEVCQMIALNAAAVSCWALGSVGGTRRRTCGGFVQQPTAADWWTGGENGAS